MEQVRLEAGDAAAGRTTRVVLRFAPPATLRRTLATLPLLALRALLAPREPSVSGLDDRQLADIGLTRAEVTRWHGRPSSAELEIQRLLQGPSWR